jgi:hypothetical protein
MRKTIVSATLALLAVTALTADASAQTRHRVRAAAPVLAASPDLGSSIPLTVNRRSWLDSGNSVSSRGGYGPSYVAANTIYNKTQDQIFAPGYFGNSTINQGPPYVPGRSQPVIEGSLPASGRPIIDNVLLPQNFYLNPAPSVP